MLTEPRAGPYERPANIHVEAASVDVMQMRAESVCAFLHVSRVLCSPARRIALASTEGSVIFLSTIEHIATRASVPVPDNMRLESRTLEGTQNSPPTVVADE